MKKVLNWFKKRAVNKGVIFVSVAAAITQLCVGNYFLAVTHFLVALSWGVVEMKDSAIEAQFNTIRLLMRDNEDLKRLMDVKNAVEEYWFFKFYLENTKVNFCKRKISCSEFIQKLQYFESMIEENRQRFENVRTKYQEG